MGTLKALRMELSTEQKARIFAMYIGQKMAVDSEIMGVSEFTITGVETRDNLVMGLSIERIPVYAGFGFNEANIILRSVSAITDEDAIEVASMYPEITRGTLGLSDIVVNKVRRTVDGWFNGQAVLNWEVREFLTQRGYAVPLFYGVGHPFNGKTAIEAGLAIGMPA